MEQWKATQEYDNKGKFKTEKENVIAEFDIEEIEKENRQEVKKEHVNRGNEKELEVVEEENKEYENSDDEKESEVTEEVNKEHENSDNEKESEVTEEVNKEHENSDNEKESEVTEEVNKEPEKQVEVDEETIGKDSLSPNEFMEVCAVAVISLDEKQKITVFNAELKPHWANKDVGEKLHITQTNVFVDKLDIENLHILAQEASLNGVDPFSSSAELKKMFDRAVAGGLIDITEAPDFNKNIIIGDKVYFKNGQIADLDENAITYDVGQLERILQAETPEQMKEMVEKIKESRNMDAQIGDTGRSVEQTRGNEGMDMTR